MKRRRGILSGAEGQGFLGSGLRAWGLEFRSLPLAVEGVGDRFNDVPTFLPVLLQLWVPGKRLILMPNPKPVNPNP